MTSTHTLMPIDYYRLPFCRPKDGVKRDNENLGEFLAGDRIENSPYVLQMKKPMFCEQVCIANLGRGDAEGVSPNKVTKSIRKNYHNNWIVDNLSAAVKFEDEENVSTRYWQGFPIGFLGNDEKKKAYINNHVNIEIMYHPVETETDKYRVVRFIVEPFSIKHEYEPLVFPKVAKIKNPILSCKDASEHTNYEMINGKHQEASGKVLFTYDVIWTENKELKWASRWDVYLMMDGAIPAKVHWLSIANGLVIVFVLSAMIVAILVRNLHRDINRYNKVAMDEESRGWKLVRYCSFSYLFTHSNPASDFLSLSSL